jgi:hypothetical protein
MFEHLTERAFKVPHLQISLPGGDNGPEKQKAIDYITFSSPTELTIVGG